MTDITALVVLSEGFPSDTPPRLAWDAAIMRHDRRRDELVSLGFSIAGAIACCFGRGTKPSIIARPFYSQREWDVLMHEREEAEQRAAEMQQIAKLRRLGNGR